jgi:hypothetical protein
VYLEHLYFFVKNARSLLSGTRLIDFELAYFDV